jgi:hypothetical protein
MAKHPSFGSSISWDPAGGTSYTALGQVTDITGPNVSRGDVDVTDHDNAVSQGGAGWREFVQGVPDAGDLTFGLIWDPINLDPHNQTEGTGILSDFESTGALASWKVELHTISGTLEWEFDGYLNGASFETPVEGTHTAEITVKISGKPSLTATS